MITSISTLSNRDLVISFLRMSKNHKNNYPFLSWLGLQNRNNLFFNNLFFNFFPNYS